MRPFWRRRTTDDFAAEVQAHIDLETDRLIGEGRSPAAAREAALRAFGNVTRVKERFYEAGRWLWLEQLGGDLRYGWRGLIHNPAFLATSVLTLAVGLALVTVAFTVFNAYVLRPYAVRDPYSLHLIGWRAQDNGGQRFRWRDYEELSRRQDLFAAVVAESTRLVSSNGRPLAIALVSGNYFEALGPRVSLGRALGGIDAAPGAGPAAVLSHQAWVRMFAADRSILGRALDVNGRPFIVVGVLAPDFTGLADMPRDAWVALPAYAAAAQPELVGAEQPRSLEIVARLRADVTPARASGALSPYFAGVMTAERAVRATVTPQPTANPLSLEMLAVLAPVFAAFVLVLVTACANVSNVMLARALTRHREIAVRLSIGASRGRVVRQLLTEGLLISLLGGGAGLALASWLLRAGTVLFVGALPASVAEFLRITPMPLDHRVYLFALGLAAAATLMFALLPALQASRLSLTDALRGQGSASRRGSRLRATLVAGQVAVSLVLVIVAATIARNGAAVADVDLGYETAGVLSINIRGESNALASPLARALESDPRVAEVAVTLNNPLFIRSRRVAAAPADHPDAVPTRFTFVSPGYFPLLRIPMTGGRGFSADEARSSARVAIVSAATAARFWPGQDPVGQTIRLEPAGDRRIEEIPGYSRVTVIGTVPDVVSGFVVDGPDAGHIYLPVAPDGKYAEALLVRGRSAQDLGPEALQELFRRVAADPQVFEVLPLGDMRTLQLYPLRAAAWIGFVLGLVALGLSVFGLYGVLTYAVSQRTREIGIRMALGATAGAVVGLVMRQSARLTGFGAGAGLVVAFGALRALNAAVRFETISLLDVSAFAGGLALVLASSALAALVPARRASRLDPAQTLRADG
jgi:predicted permease